MSDAIHPASFEHQLQFIFTSIQHDKIVSADDVFFFNDVETMDPFRCRSEPVTTPTRPFSGLDDAICRCSTGQRPTKSCGILDSNMRRGEQWAEAFLRFWVSASMRVEEQDEALIGDFRR